MAKACKKDFETQLARLEAIVDELESGEAPLERAVELYKEGVTLVRSCRERLEKASNEVRVFSEGAFLPMPSQSGPDAADAPDEEENKDRQNGPDREKGGQP